jgi:hypothetical protein
LTDEEAFWTALSAWATFQPRQTKPREDPGQLFYPNEYSHVFEKDPDYLPCLDQHPGFKNESQCSQYHMILFSQALSGMSDQAAFGSKPAAEAKQTDIEISEDAAIFRSRPIQDGLDYWEEHSICADTRPDGSAPG